MWISKKERHRLLRDLQQVRKSALFVPKVRSFRLMAGCAGPKSKNCGFDPSRGAGERQASKVAKLRVACHSACAGAGGAHGMRSADALRGWTRASDQGDEPNN